MLINLGRFIKICPWCQRVYFDQVANPIPVWRCPYCQQDISLLPCPRCAMPFPQYFWRCPSCGWKQPGYALTRGLAAVASLIALAFAAHAIWAAMR